jgi:hypothetical protein
VLGGWLLTVDAAQGHAAFGQSAYWAGGVVMLAAWVLAALL